MHYSIVQIHNMNSVLSISELVIGVMSVMLSRVLNCTDEFFVVSNEIIAHFLMIVIYIYIPDA